MQRRFLTAVAVLSLLLAAGQGVALLLNFEPGQVLRAVDLNALVSALTGGTDATPIDVNCASVRLTDALKTALPGSVIRISGTCAETVVIHTPRLTLDGQGSAIIDGGGSQDGIFVAGVRGVHIRDLTVQNGLAGIRSEAGAALTLSNVTVQNNSKWGILVENNATVFLSDSRLRGNGQDGIAVENKSSTAMQNVTITNNREDGIAIKNGSSARISNSTVESNEENGISVDNGSSAEISTTTIKDNGRDTNIQSSGISIENNSSAAIRASTITMNRIDGVSVEGASGAVIDGSTITNNTQVGVSAENGATVTIRGTPGQPKFPITGNGVHNLEVLFGALLTIDQANIDFAGSLHCQLGLGFARNFTGTLLSPCSAI